ncbi:MAG: heme ABC transporter permease [Pseudomonadota bacterium]
MSDASLTIRGRTGLWALLGSQSGFMKVSGAVLPFVSVLAFAVTAVGLVWGWNAPLDYQQGETVRIMYVHVPAAWFAMFCYMVMAFSAVGTLVWNHPMAGISIRAAAPIGAAFTLICLITGSLWGRPMWGTWWVWDARLTSVFILLLMYLGIIALGRTLDDPERAEKPVAILVLVGVVNIPIIKFSVDIWNTLHQPASVIRMDGPTIHPTMLWPLIICAVGFSLVFLALHLAEMRNEVRARRIARLRKLSVRLSRGGPSTAMLEKA